MCVDRCSDSGIVRNARVRACVGKASCIPIGSDAERVVIRIGPVRRSISASVSVRFSLSDPSHHAPGAARCLLRCRVSTVLARTHAHSPLRMHAVLSCVPATRRRSPGPRVLAACLVRRGRTVTPEGAWILTRSQPAGNHSFFPSFRCDALRTGRAGPGGRLPRAAGGRRAGKDCAI